MMQYAIFTNQGDREYNEDYAIFTENGEQKLFVLCDGLGGHGMGDQASQLVCSAFMSMLSEGFSSEEFLETAFQAAQDALLSTQIALHATMKMRTTAVACLIDHKKVYIGHVGDSRCYLFRHGKVKTRTLDHSIPQMMVLTKKIPESAIRHHPQRNIVLKAMGEKWEQPQYSLMKPFSLGRNDVFLLCSDGFWELIEEKDMCRLLKEAKNPSEWLEKMAAVVQENGAELNMDNYTAIAVWNE